MRRLDEHRTPLEIGIIVRPERSEPDGARWHRHRFDSHAARGAPNFSDAIATVRGHLWFPDNLRTSASSLDPLKMPSSTLGALMNFACYAA